jgi:hypothetical protein
MHKNQYSLAALALNLALLLVGLAGTSSVLPAQDTIAQEVGRFDLFLDNHPDVAQELTKDPSLINNASYVQSHPALQAFLEDHSQIRVSLQQNPQGFMNGVSRFDTAEEDHVGQLTRRQIISLDDFLDKHPGLTKQLEADPSLVHSQAFMKANPELVAFLKTHPELSEDVLAHPSMVMNDAARFDALEAQRTEGRAGQVAAFDGFLDDHPVIAAQLEAHPSLADSAEFVDAHPELKTFLQNHPGVLEDLRNNPRVFLNRLQNFDRHEAKLEQHQASNHK